MAKGNQINGSIHMADGTFLRPGDEDRLKELDKAQIKRLKESGAITVSEDDEEDAVITEADPTIAASMQSKRRDRKGKKDLPENSVIPPLPAPGAGAGGDEDAPKGGDV